MSFDWILAPAAEEQFFKFPPLVQKFLERKLDRLGEDPGEAVRQSKKLHPVLHVSTLFVTEPEQAYDGRPHYFYIPWRFAQNEKDIQILAISPDLSYEWDDI
jgi:hypothetical protein